MSAGPRSYFNPDLHVELCGTGWFGDEEWVTIFRHQQRGEGRFPEYFLGSLTTGRGEVQKSGRDGKGGSEVQASGQIPELLRTLGGYPQFVAFSVNSVPRRLQRSTHNHSLATVR